MPSEHSVQENPLIDYNKVLLPPLDMKLDLMKYSVKNMDKNSAAFQHLCTLFLALSSTKHKEDIIVGAQIRVVLKGKDFEKFLILTKLRTWEYFKISLL